MHYVYIIYSASKNVYYKGYSTDVHKRLQYHLQSNTKYTSSAVDWNIVYSKPFTDKEAALVEERRLKKLNRRSLEKLIRENRTIE